MPVSIHPCRAEQLLQMQTGDGQVGLSSTAIEQTQAIIFDIDRRVAQLMHRSSCCTSARYLTGQTCPFPHTFRLKHNFLLRRGPLLPRSEQIDPGHENSLRWILGS